jgi:hypothetical protein
MNIELFRRIQSHILEDPKRVVMDCWRGQDEDCGTVACIAGWACILEGNKARNFDIPEEAEKLLGIDGIIVEYLGHFYPLRDFLYYPCGWTGPIRDRYMHTKYGSPELAQAVSDYIDYFIETYSALEPSEGEIN